MSPTARTLAWCRKQGWIAEVTERWIPQARKRKDLFSFIDIVCLRPNHFGVLGIQATSTPNINARLTKIAAEPKAKLWQLAGNPILVIGWSKKGPRGKRKVWVSKEVWL